MKKNILFAIILPLFFGCSYKKDDSKSEANTPISGYRKQLYELGFIESSSLNGLELFKNSFQNQNQVVNDSALRIYLEFQSQLIDTLNNRLFMRPDFENLNSLAMADTTLHEQDAKEFEAELKKNGLRLSSSEGSIFIIPETNIISTYFSSHLTEPTQQFLQQIIIEINQPYAEDGGLAIPVKTLSKRLIFWDRFLTNNPDHLYADYAKSRKNEYLYFLMIGLNNTPAFDYDSKKLDAAFLEAYSYISKTASDTESGQAIATYLKILATNDYEKNTEVEKFLTQYDPYSQRF